MPFKSGIIYIYLFRCLLFYLVVTALCAACIVVGNQLLIRWSCQAAMPETLLQLEYSQWLPVCARVLAISCMVSLLLDRLWLHRWPLWLSGLLYGTVTLCLLWMSGIIDFSPDQCVYTLKNTLVFFSMTFLFIACCRRL